MASAKFAKSTVNQSHIAICTPKPSPGAPVKASRTTKTVVKAAPTSTTNMTGFLTSVTGFSLTKDSFSARPAISGSNKGRARSSFLGINVVGSDTTGGVIVVAIRTVSLGASGNVPRQAP